MSATERFKMLLANSLERVCVLEAALEDAQARLAELDPGPIPDDLPSSPPEPPLRIPLSKHK